MIKVCFGDKYDDVSYGSEQNVLFFQQKAKDLRSLRSLFQLFIFLLKEHINLAWVDVNVN